MRVKFTHPAIVSGQNPDGSPKAELCRMESEFEVPEYSFDDAPVALVASGLSRPSDYFHLHDGKLYKAFPDGQDSGHFADGSPLSYGLHNGNSHHVHFEPFYETVSRSAARIEDESGYALQLNIKRELLKRETKINMREVTKACLNAPMLRKWNWLSPDVDHEITHWRSIAAEKISNIVLINGVPALRAFEPCYVLNETYGAPQIQVGSKRAYANQVHVVDKASDGLELLGEGSRQRHAHYFAASDYDGAEAFAKEIGWRLLPDQKPRINIRDEAAVTDDFDTLETVRHAHLLLEAVDSREAQYQIDSYTREGTDVAPMLAQLKTGVRTLKGELLSWQNQKSDVNGVRRELVTQMEHALACARECSNQRARQGAGCDPLLIAVSVRGSGRWVIDRQLEHFLVRADQAEVRLDIPMAIGFGR
jgi:hypothetical protein